MFHGFHRITMLENDGFTVKLSQNNNTYSSYVLWSCKVLKVNSYKEVHAMKSNLAMVLNLGRLVKCLS